MASAPIITPLVGVTKFTRPLPAENIDIITSDEKPKDIAKGPNIGIDNPARPEVDGMKNDSIMYIMKATIVNTIGDIPFKSDDAAFST